MRGAGGTPGGILEFVLGVGMAVGGGYLRRSMGGWLLVFAGTIIMFAGIIANLRIYFRVTSLFETLVMLFLLAAGIGLVARALRPHDGR